MVPACHEFLIPATNHPTACVRVSETTYHELMRHRWNCFTTRQFKVYFRRSIYVSADKRGTLLLHREVMRIRGIEPPDDERRYVVDHIDDDHWNCEDQNLAWTTYRDNHPTIKKTSPRPLEGRGLHRDLETYNLASILQPA